MAPPDQTRRARVGWLLDGTGALARASVELAWQGDRLLTLAEVDPGAPVAADTLDLRGCTALPGLVDAHVHLTMEATADPTRRQAQLRTTHAERLPVMVRHLAAHAAQGVVAVRDGGDYGGFALRLRDAMAQSTSPDPPVLLRAAGRAWRAEGRYGRLIGRPPAPGQSLAEAVATDPDPVDHVKIVQSGVNSLRTFGRPTAPQWSTDALRAAVAAAAARGRSVMVHANGAEPVGRALAAGVASVEHGYFAGLEVLARAAHQGTVWVPTLAPMWAYAEHEAAPAAERGVARQTLEHQLEQVRRAHALGIPLAAGSDAGSLGVEHGAGLWRELWLLAQAGLSVPAVVQAATSVGARLSGAGERTGALRPGGPATWMALPGAPSGLLASPCPSIEALCLEGRLIAPRDH